MALVVICVLSAPAQVSELGGFDKVLHFGANVAIVDVAWTATALADAPLWARMAVSVGAAVVISVGKEVWDIRFGDPSIYDLAYDALGIGAGVGYALAMEAIVRSLCKTRSRSGLCDAAAE